MQLSPEFLLILQTLGVGSLLAVVLKEIFAWRSSREAHRLRLSEIMLDKIHKSAGDYYMPLAGTAKAFSSSLNNILQNPNDDEAIRLAFRCFIDFFTRLYLFQMDVGGYFLQSYDVEKKLSSIIYILYKEITPPKGEVTRHDLFIAMKRAAVNRKKEDYFLTWDEDPDFKNIFSSFKNWLSDIESVKRVKDCSQYYGELFEYELNSIFKTWYRKGPREIPAELSQKVDRVLRGNA